MSKKEQFCMSGKSDLIDLELTQPWEIIDEDIEAWIQRKTEENPNIRRSTLLNHLSERLCVGYRHMMRYRTGEAPLPLNKIKTFCETVESNRLIEFLAFELGAAVIKLPHIEEIDDFDIVEELTKNINKYSKLSHQLAESFSRKLNGKDFNIIKYLTKQAVTQALKCLSLYERAWRARLKLRQKKKELDKFDQQESFWNLKEGK